MQDSELIIVYVDVVLTVNFVMDFIILWAVKKLAGIKAGVFRLLMGALLGACYAVTVMLWPYSFLATLPAGLICSLLMTAAAFTPVRKKMFLRIVLYLYLISFTMGGAVIGIIYLTELSAGYMPILNGSTFLLDRFNYEWLTIAVLVAFLIVSGGAVYWHKNWIRQNLISKLIVCQNGKRIEIDAFLDTGNQLIDPITQKPVVVVEVKALYKLLPLEIIRVVENSNDDISLSELGEELEQEWRSRLHLIPFNSVGRSHGIMVGFRPDLIIIIRKNEKELQNNEVIVGLVRSPLAKDGRYHALLHPELLREAN